VQSFIYIAGIKFHGFTNNAPNFLKIIVGFGMTFIVIETLYSLNYPNKSMKHKWPAIKATIVSQMTKDI